MIDPILWLKNQWLYPKVYWEKRGSGTIYAGCGKIAETREVPTHSHLPFFGCLGFDQERKDVLWKEFPAPYFFSPALEWKCSDAKEPSDTRYVFAPSTRTDLPSQEDWVSLVTTSLESIRRAELAKVVLARRTTWTFSERLDPYELLAHLRAQTREETLFLIQMTEESAFIGATPELLFTREGNALASEAVAGTRPRGKTRDRDQELAQMLIACTKEQQEHDFVKKGIENALAALCKTIDWKPQIVRSTATVHHLVSRLRGLLDEDVSDSDLLSKLHPTPAMGGFPKEEALQHLRKRESFDRGWYASPIGWITPSRSEFAVAIRSALIEGTNLHAFTGAGIVENCDPLKEWEELEQKMRFYYSASNI